jgi:hypothetical protein
MALEPTVDTAPGRPLIGDEARFDRSSRLLVGCYRIGERASELSPRRAGGDRAGGTLEIFIGSCATTPTLGGTFEYAAYDRSLG